MKNMNVQTQSAIRVIRGNKPFCRVVASVSAATFLLISAAPAFAGTTSFLGGNSELSQLTNAKITQNDPDAAAFSSTSASAVLDWAKFNIGSGQSMSFNGRGTTFFNLVDGAAGKSQIDGIINGNGSVWVINPAGIAFGANSSVNVGGLFAAAAGVVENAAELRAGTAMTPTFSAFGGEVDATKGTFVADQIALMGGKAAVGGEADFTGAFKVDVGAGDHLIVDDVGGGMVAIDLAQFADAAKDVLDISGLDAGDALVDVVANGNVKATGDIQAGRLQVMAANDVDLAADVTTSMGEVSVGSLNKGDVTLSGDVDAAAEVQLVADGGSVTINGGSVVSHGGKIQIVGEEGVSVGETAQLASEKIGIAAMTGDAVVDGIVKADVAEVNAFGGSVRLANKDNAIGTVVSEAAGSIDVATADGVTLGDITAKGGDVRVLTVAGDIVVDGIVKTEAENGTVLLKAATNPKANGNLIVNGDLKASAEGGKVIGYAGYGKLKAEGKIQGEDVDMLMSALRSNGLLGAAPGGSSVVILNNKAEVMAERLIILEGEAGVHSSGLIDAGTASLEVYGHRGDINLYEDLTGRVITGDIYLAAEGEVIANNPANDITGSVDGESGAGVFEVNVGSGDTYTEVYGIKSEYVWIKAEKGSIKVVGDLTAPDMVVLETEEGDIIVLEDCAVEATGAGAVVWFNAKRNVQINGKVKAEVIELDAGRDLTVGKNGSVTAAGSVLLNAGRDASVNGAVSGFQVMVAGGRNVKSSAEGAVSATGLALVNAETGKATLQGSISSAYAAVKVAARGDVTVGDITAGGYTISEADGDIYSIKLESDSGKVVVGDGATLRATDELGGIIKLNSKATDPGKGGILVEGDLFASNRNGDGHGTVDVRAANGDVTVNGSVYADEYAGATAANGGVTVNGSIGSAISVDVRAEEGSVTVNGDVLAGNVAYATTGNGDVLVSGSVVGGNDVSVQAGTRGNVTVAGSVVAGNTAFVTTGNGSVNVAGSVDGKVNALVESFGGGHVTVDGTVASDDAAFVATKGGDVTINGTVLTRGQGEVNGAMVSTVNGNIRVNGQIRGGGADGIAVAVAETSGDIVFGSNGRAAGNAGVILKTGNGDLVQNSGDSTHSHRGHAERVNLQPAASGSEILLSVNGNVASDRGGYFAVDGKVFGKATGDMRIAAANGKDMRGGEKPGDKIVIPIGEGTEIDFSDMGDNQSLLAGGGLFAYTAGKLQSYGRFESNMDVDISAASFGDMSYLYAGGVLSVNNVGHPAHPQIAYFEGQEPRINNQPNDTVIFVNGRLAGGNLQIINKFGATEAFPVSTPELKSEQGIFGNPVFLHGDLDVANPMAVGNVDYMLQEIPRLTLASDFPLEIDKSVNTAGLNPKDVYRFGQHQQVAEEKPQTDQEEQKDDKASAEQSAEPKVAMR